MLINFVLFPLNNSNHDCQHHSYYHSGYLYVVDLGTDTLSVYRFNDANGNISLVGNRIKIEAGAGPSHIIFHPTKSLTFLCNELNSTTNVYRINILCEKFEYL
ncbi:unnamed protein product [Rotaria sp. Silwood1]|nr:unnamed protein product [Rotaria sp. Silwood1]CAF3813976.1 unnamed protein product [Rotaria sp. Silwood1]CAF4830127.1 unnamed protein product [Rotaria sp. Silwood1]CAF4845174.1 unnamed protein product [Rotaria sp. Silwood1]